MIRAFETFVAQIKSSIYWQLLYRIALALCFYTVFRLFFFIINYDYFTSIDFSRLMIILSGGVIFDISAVLYSNLLLILLSILPLKYKYQKQYQKVLSSVFYVFNILCFIVNAMDIVYYRFTLRRTTATFFNEFGNNNNIGNIFSKSLLDFWPVTLGTLVLIIAFVYLAKKGPKPTLHLKSNWAFYIGQTLLIPVILVLCIGGLRGGFAESTRPITLSNASKFIENGNERALVLNTPFALIRTIGSNSLKRLDYFTPEEIKLHYSVEHSKTVSSTDTLRNEPNVVIIILESFGRGHVGFFNKDLPNYKSYTPFIDSLCEHSLVYKNAFANGRKSIDALPSIIASIPSIKEPFVLSTYSGNEINSLATILGKQGYYSAFFHGAPNGSMGFDAFIKQAGYNDYFGKTEFNDDSKFDGVWGIWDEPFMQYYANTLSTFKEPFLGTLFSLSSHHPFKIPEEYEDVFPEGEIPLQRCLMYTDNALRKFFNTSKNEEWFKNTVFVITADHGTYTPIPKYQTSAGYFSIPLIFYAPGNPNLIGYNDSTYVQQIDIMPTLLNNIGVENDYLAFGTDIKDLESKHFAFNYTGGFFQITKDDYYIQFDGEKTHALYNIVKDPLLEKNLLNEEPEIAEELEILIKCMIQEYSNRLIDNKLTITDS